MTVLESTRLSPSRLAVCLLPLAAFGVILGLDAIAPHTPRTFFVVAAFDEPAHLLTAALVLAALGIPYLRPFSLAMLAASVLIDLDHIPDALGADWLTRGTPRPYTHSLLTLLVLGALAAILLWRGHRRAATIAAGASAGVALHLFRDLAVPQSSGVALAWPVSDHAAGVPYAAYAAVLGVIAAAAASRNIMESTRIQRHRSPGMS